MTRTVITMGLAMLALTGLASASPAGSASKVAVTLWPSSVVQKPMGVPNGARGSFTGWFRDEGRGLVRFEYRVSYTGLTGPPTGIDIHLGKPGATGRVLISLCDRESCQGGQSTFGHISRRLVELLKTGSYVDVHTAKNPRGELRGQLPAFSID